MLFSLSSLFSVVALCWKFLGNWARVEKFFPGSCSCAVVISILFFFRFQISTHTCMERMQRLFFLASGLIHIITLIYILSSNKWIWYPSLPERNREWFWSGAVTNESFSITARGKCGISHHLYKKIKARNSNNNRNEK